MGIRYVEARRILAPWVVGAGAITDIGEKKIDLCSLQDKYKQDDPEGQKQFWKSHEAVGRHGLKFGEWFPRFGAGAFCVLTSTVDPGDCFEQEHALQGIFTGPALAAMDAAIQERLPADAPDGVSSWHLEHISIRWLPDCSLVDIISVFDVPDASFSPKDFGNSTEALSVPLDGLWPVFFATIENAWRTVCADAQAKDLWSHSDWAFGLPKSLRVNHPDFDPSEELQLDTYLILTGLSPKRSESIRSGLGVRLHRATELANDGVLWLSDWTVAVWERPGEAAQDHLALANSVLGTTLVGLMLKEETFNQRLYAAILNELAAEHSPRTARIVRPLMGRTEQLRQSLHKRTRRLGDWQRDVFNDWAKGCRLSDERERADRLCELALAAAEGTETRQQQLFDRKVEALGLGFLGMSLVAVILELWLFTHGAGEESAEYWLPPRVTVAVSAITAAILFSVLLVTIYRNWSACR